MNLNDLSPAKGAKKNAKRKGRGIGSGTGKTCGRGHKGQKSRSGGKVALGFEGGQTPLYRRIPKFGFTSRIGRFTRDIRLSELNKLSESKDPVDVDTFKNAGLIPKHVKRVRIFLSGTYKGSVKLCSSVKLTRGVKKALSIKED